MPIIPADKYDQRLQVMVSKKQELYIKKTLKGTGLTISKIGRDSLLKKCEEIESRKAEGEFDQ